MYSINDFLDYSGAAPAPKKTSVTPTRRNLAAIRRTVKSSDQLARTGYRIEASQPVNILSPEFMNGAMKVSSRFAAPTRTSTAVIMPEDNQPRKTVLIDSDAMQVSCPLEIVRYSDASFAVFGKTKQYKDDLQSLGGKFNNWLKRDCKPTPGYIFPNWRKESVLRYMERF
jgi:hypothetical protein